MLLFIVIFISRIHVILDMLSTLHGIKMSIQMLKTLTLSKGSWVIQKKELHLMLINNCA